MKTRNGFVAIVALVVISCFAISAYADQAPKPPSDVNVVNTPLDVNAAQSGTWDVNVANTDSEPVPVTVTNTPAREPDSMFIEISAPNLAQQDEQIYTVPDGKRFVIETVSVTATLGSNIKLLRVGIIRNSGPARAVWLPMFLQGEGAGGKTYWTGTEQVRMDVRPTESVRFFAVMSGTTGDEYLQANVFGYLIPWDSPSFAP